MDTYSKLFAVVYSVAVIMLISHFIITLVLAALCESFKEENRIFEEKMIKK